MRKCAICGETGLVPFGYRRAGFLSELPKDKRGTLWTCAKDACRDAAEKRKTAADQREGRG